MAWLGRIKGAASSVAEGAKSPLGDGFIDDWRAEFSNGFRIAVGEDQVSIPRVGEADFENLAHPGDAGFVTDGCDHFNSIFKISSHPVGAAQIPPPVGGVGLASRKVEDS